MDEIGNAAITSVQERSDRRAAALNAVDLAREHAGNKGSLYSQNEADVIVAIMELLDRIASADRRQ